MSGLIKKLFFILIAGLIALPALAQKDRKEELAQRKTQLQDEIEFANKILNETRRSEKKSISELEALVQKIRIREELIRTINREMRIINREIADLQEQVDTLEKTTEKLKGEYAKMVRQSFKKRNSKSGLLFVLSSKDFDQAVKRVTYLKQIAEYREHQVAEIKARQEELKVKITELEQRKKQQERLKNNKQEERQNLVGEKEEQEEVVGDLKDREREIIKEIKAKQREADKLEKEIERVIAEEMRRAREAAERKSLEDEAIAVGLVSGKDFTNRTNNKRLRAMINEKRKSMNLEPEPEKTTAPAYNLTPDAKRLAANFAANKGTLPWPVERGIIVGKFGKQPHPLVKGIVVNNPHIEIATEKGAKARAAFDGEVTSVIRIPGANKAVLVRHGNYFTVYGNLVEVDVKSGDKVTTKQQLGTIYTDKENSTVLQFGLWLDDKIQNPEPWLVR